MMPRTREWLRKAESDRRVVRLAMCAQPPEYDAACFHCQQAVEKHLKGLLHERGQPVPKTHDLIDLVDRLLPSDPQLKPLRTTAGRLTIYAVLYRYPGFHATKQRAQTACKTMEPVRAEIRRRLGLRPRP
ncbi:MAG TPA: HEPN domain-containing protein [Gemmataceae bacterium]|jgi:HEPN domain-containing protein